VATSWGCAWGLFQVTWQTPGGKSRRSAGALLAEVEERSGAPAVAVAGNTDARQVLEPGGAPPMGPTTPSRAPGSSSLVCQAQGVHRWGVPLVRHWGVPVARESGKRQEGRRCVGDGGAREDCARRRTCGVPAWARHCDSWERPQDSDGVSIALL